MSDISQQYQDQFNRYLPNQNRYIVIPNSQWHPYKLRVGFHKNWESTVASYSKSGQFRQDDTNILKKRTTMVNPVSTLIERMQKFETLFFVKDEKYKTFLVAQPALHNKFSYVLDVISYDNPYFSESIISLGHVNRDNIWSIITNLRYKFNPQIRKLEDIRRRVHWDTKGYVV